MGFWDRAEALWQQTAQQHVHGWVQSDHPTAAIEPGEGKHYLQVRLAAMSLRFSRQRFAGRSPVLHSSVRWPVAGGWITVSHTLDRARFTAPGGDTTDFAVYQVSDVALSSRPSPRWRPRSRTASTASGQRGGVRCARLRHLGPC